MMNSINSFFSANQPPPEESEIHYILGESTTAIFASNLILNLTGYSSSEFINSIVDFIDLIHPHDHDLVLPRFALQSTPSQKTIHFRIRHKQGHILCVKGLFSHTFDPHSSSPLLILSLQNAKHLAHSLENHTLLTNFTVMMETTDDYIYFKDRNHVFTGASQTLVSVTEPSEHWTDLIGLTDYDVFPEHYADEYYKLEKMVFSGEIQIAHEIQPTLDNQGKKGWVDNRKYPIRNEKGEIIGLFGIARNITEFQTLHLELQKKVRLLENSNKIFDEAGDAIALLNQNGFFDCNKATLKLLGFSEKSEFINTPIDAICPSKQPDGRSSMEARTEAIQLAQKKGMHRFDWVNRHTNGNLIDTEITITVINIEEEQVFHIHWRDITERKGLLQRIAWQATHDPLSNLPNRTLLADRFQQAFLRAQREQQYLLVVILDLDHFKPVNDYYGHSTGDKLIIQVAQRLTKLIRSSDTVSRLGGDEFVLLLSDFTSEAEMHDIMQRILQEVSSPYDIEKTTINITASIGVTSFPSDNHDADTLLRHADQAMYQAKQSGRNCIHWFDIEQDKLTVSSLDTIKQVKKALTNNELELYYQPKINALTHQIVGMEALLRWQHPVRGLVPPLDFLPLVEQTDVIVDIGDWVIRQALQQIRTWEQQDYSWTVSVNIAARHFQQPNFEESLRDLLLIHDDVQPQQLEIELLESVAIHDIQHINHVMKACQQLGVKFALDDFGTGYSSLNYLKQLPAETIKIDQSFVKDILHDEDALTLVKSVLSLANHFKRKTIAEGVETQAHETRLLELGCDELQGYGIARPMPESQIPQWVKHYQNQHPPSQNSLDYSI